MQHAVPDYAPEIKKIARLELLDGLYFWMKALGVLGVALFLWRFHDSFLAGTFAVLVGYAIGNGTGALIWAVGMSPRFLGSAASREMWQNVHYDKIASSMHADYLEQHTLSGIDRTEHTEAEMKIALLERRLYLFNPLHAPFVHTRRFIMAFDWIVRVFTVQKTPMPTTLRQRRAAKGPPR